MALSGGTVHRKLRFTSLDEMMAEAERLAAAERAGKLARRGAWTLGQALNHLATWMDFFYDGYPAELKVPGVVRFVLRMMRGRVFKKGLSPGVRLKGIKNGTVGAEPMETDAALAKLRRAMERMKTMEPKFPSPAFGMLTREEAVQLNLRHGELHLGFQDVVGS